MDCLLIYHTAEDKFSEKYRLALRFILRNNNPRKEDFLGMFLTNGRFFFVTFLSVLSGYPVLRQNSRYQHNIIYIYIYI
jgi:hypothetical protein